MPSQSVTLPMHRIWLDAIVPTSLSACVTLSPTLCRADASEPVPAEIAGLGMRAMTGVVRAAEATIWAGTPTSTNRATLSDKPGF